MKKGLFIFCKRAAFILLGLQVAALAAATFVEHAYGTETALRHFYHAPWFFLLWMAVCSCGAVWVCSRKRAVHVLLIHLAFILILAGAGLSFLTSRNGRMHLREGETTRLYANSDRKGHVGHLPFDVTLTDFSIKKRKNTADAQDFVSQITITDKDGRRTNGTISMNNVLTHGGFRFCQMGYDRDQNGTTLAVRRDVPGLHVTYCGYALLFFALVGMLVSRQGVFRQQLRHHPFRKRTTNSSPAQGKAFRPEWLYRAGLTAAALACSATGYVLCTHGIAHGRLPLTNGYEVLMAIGWLSSMMAMSTAFLRKGPACRLMCGLCLAATGLSVMAAEFFSSGNGTVLPLPPVLDSSLLDVHVAFIIIAYTLMTLTFLSSTAAITAAMTAGLHTEKGRCILKKMQAMTRMLLYPALTCIGIGIFIGAIWGNETWGRYWGWDAKETWALITMIVYALPLHAKSLHLLRRPVVFHTYLLLAFACVLMTYFGVNYWLSGLHSYA